MMTLDHYAATSRLRDVRPGLKLLFALPPLLLLQWAGSIAFSITIVLLMGASAILKGGVRPLTWLRWLALPALFLVSGTGAVAFDLAQSPVSFIVQFPVGGEYAGVTQEGLRLATHLFFRSLASVSCLYFIAFTTPVADLTRAMSSLGVPSLLVEMTLLLYRFVFLLFETAGNIATAQHSRLGYVGLSASFRSFAALVSSLFVLSARRSEVMYAAMESRGYDGTMRFVPPSSASRQPSAAILLLLQLFLVALASVARQGGAL